jgi:glycosyltransferase involved in cell wall biosynthesis
VKVLYVLPPDGSTLEVDESRPSIFTVAALLSRQGIEVSILLPAGMQAPEVLGIRLYRWPPVFSAEVLRQVLRETRPTAVHVENCPWLVPVLRQTYQGYVLLYLQSLRPLSQDLISRRDLRLSLCLVDQVVVNSFFLKNLFIGRFYGLRLRVDVVYPGVDGSVFLPAVAARGLMRERQKQRRLWEVEPDEKVILIAYTPHDPKGSELLLNCPLGTELSRLKFLVVGSAPPSASHVIPIDALQPKVYRAADIFLCPLQERAAAGHICLPAMATALPVVASLRGSVPEVVGTQAGYFVRQFADAKAWANGLLAVTRNASLQKTMAEAGLRRSRAFTWERTAREFLALFSRGHLSLG